MTIADRRVMTEIDFEWWRRKGCIPGRLLIPISLMYFPDYHLVIFRRSCWNFKFEECLKDICDIHPIDINRLVCISRLSLHPEVWENHTFKGYNQREFLYPSYISIPASVGHDLMENKISPRDFYAIKKDDPQTIESHLAIKSH